MGALMRTRFSQAVRALPYQGTLVVSVEALPAFVVPGFGDGVSTATALEIGPGANFTTTRVVPTCCSNGPPPR